MVVKPQQNNAAVLSDFLCFYPRKTDLPSVVSRDDPFQPGPANSMEI